jgi:hypothetical protein
LITSLLQKHYAGFAYYNAQQNDFQLAAIHHVQSNTKKQTQTRLLLTAAGHTAVQKDSTSLYENKYKGMKNIQVHIFFALVMIPIIFEIKT